MSIRILRGDCRDVLKTLPAESVHCVVTSPPYFGLRDYGTAKWSAGDANCDHLAPLLGGFESSGLAKYENGLNAATIADKVKQRQQQYRSVCGKCGATRVDNQIGLEPTPTEFLQAIVEVFREVRRVLRPDGTIWVNMGDSYASSGKGGDTGKSGLQGSTESQDQSKAAAGSFRRDRAEVGATKHIAAPGLKPKDLMMMPARVALALQADGWWLRQDIVWHKPNPMPESITDRCTKAHEYVFLLSKSERYYFDNEAIKEPASENTNARRSQKMPDGWDTGPGGHGSFHRNGREKGETRKVLPETQSRLGNFRDTQRKLAEAGSGTKNNESFDEAMAVMPDKRNKRSVWTIPTEAFPEAHFATFPTALAEPCILAGCPKGGVVLDPFGGAGTTALVADRHGRDAILIELNPEYAAMAERRIRGDAPLFVEVTA